MRLSANFALNSFIPHGKNHFYYIIVVSLEPTFLYRTLSSATFYANHFYFVKGVGKLMNKLLVPLLMILPKSH